MTDMAEVPTWRGRLSTIRFFAVLLSPILLFLFVYFLELAKNSKDFLALTFSSFVFLGLATYLLLSSRMEEATRDVRYILYAITIISIITMLVMANSIATVPRGGLRHSYHIPLNDVEGTIKWERAYYGTFTKHGAYYGTFEQTLCEVNYPVGFTGAHWDIWGVHLNVIRTNYTENLTGRLWFFLELWPNDIYRSREAEFTLHGSGDYIKFYPLSIYWGSCGPEVRFRLDKGYKVILCVTIKIEASADYGDFHVYIPLSYVTIDDVQVASQFQDGIAILLCGIFVGIYTQILAKPAVNFLKRCVRKSRGEVGAHG